MKIEMMKRAAPDEVTQEEFLEFMGKKADRKELTRLVGAKVNKDDFADQMHAIDIMHRQIAHLSVLMLELSRLQLNEKNETKTAIRQKRMYMLDQIVNVVNWVQKFDPQNVNLPDFNVPPYLRQLDNLSRTAVADYPKSSR